MDHVLSSAFKKTMIFITLAVFSSSASAEYYLSYYDQPIQRATTYYFPCPCCHYQKPKVHKHKVVAVKHKCYHPVKKHRRHAKTGLYQPPHWVNGHWISGAYLGEGFNVYPRKIRKHMTHEEKVNYDADLTTGDDNPYLNPDMDIDY
ncbi:MAG: hypothetical protein WAW86_02490 [Gammaproteobacteria bacterium]